MTRLSKVKLLTYGILIFLLITGLSLPISSFDHSQSNISEITSHNEQEPSSESARVSNEDLNVPLLLNEQNDIDQTPHLDAFEAPETELTSTSTHEQSQSEIYRGSRAQEIENNNHPLNATPLTSSSEDITGTISSGSDDDWFRKVLGVDFDAGSPDDRYIEHFNLTLNSLTGSSGDLGKNFQVLVYSVYDINQDQKTDFESEMIFMKAENYKIGFGSSDYVAFNAYHNTWEKRSYYILFRTKDASANYNFHFSVSTQMNPGETNQNIEHADQITVNPPNFAMYYVKSNTDTFDWFKVYKAPPPDVLGHNFTLDVTVNSSLPQENVLVDGKTIHFVTVLNILVYHEMKLGTGNKPVYPFRYRDHIKISLTTSSGYKRKTVYSDVITLPTKLFSYTFLGFYVESYGVDEDNPDVKVYPIIDNIGTVTNGWAIFTIDQANTKTVKRPELSKVKVESKTTQSIFGRTYDTYIYSVVYKQPENRAPMVREISVYGVEGEIREKMVKVSKKTASQNVFKTGCKYEFTLSGALLGEGDYHIFQLHFKDSNAWATGTIELGKSWHGPFISNNLRPYVRPTAPSKLTLYEDDNTTFFDLNIIFEDSDVKEELNYTIGDPKVEPVNRTWEKHYSDDILEVDIVNQTRLKINLKPNMNGEVNILLNVTDKNQYHLNYSYEFRIRVLPVNDPPQIIKYFTSLKIYEDQINAEINLYEHFADNIDFDELTFRVGDNRNINVTISDEGDVTITPNPNWHGTEYIDFFASDGLAEVTDYLKVHVKSVNDVPIMNVNETIELWQDQWANFTIEVFDTADNESIHISHNITDIFPMLGRAPEKFGYTFDNNTGYFTLKPTNSMVGTYSWNVSAMDTKKALNYTIVELIVNNINDPPVPNILFPNNGAKYLTTDKISFRGSVYDPDKGLKDIVTPPISFTWYTTLHGVRHKIASGSILEPKLYENGTHTITLMVNDGEYIRNTSIVVYVFAINKKLDIDGDDIPDYWEELYSLNKKDPHDAEDDYDKDTFSNWEEYKAQTDPRDQYSVPSEHISRESSSDSNLPIISGFFVVVFIIMIILVIFMMMKVRRKRREDKAEAESAAGKKEGEDKKTYYGKYKPPKVVCHVCGASFEVMTLNRPVAITCNQCNSRGVIY